MTLVQWRLALRTAAIVLVTAGAGFLVGRAAATSMRLAVLLIVFAVGLALCLRRPVWAAVGALMAVFYVERFGGTSSAPGSSGGVSYSDAVLTVAAAVAVPAVVRFRALTPLRAPLLALAFYLATLLPTIALNHTTRGDLEWGHRAVLVGGALVVGAWIVHEGMARPALRLFLCFGALMGLVMLVLMTLHHFDLHYQPLRYQKNYIGGLLSNCVAIAVSLNRWLRFRRGTFIAVTALPLAGALAVQSRGSWLGACVGLFVAALASGVVHGRRTRVAAVLVAIVLGYLTYLSVEHQLHAPASEVANGSIGVRESAAKVAHRIWHSSPLIGVGLRYFIGGEDRWGPFVQAPHNFIDNELAEAGVVGCFGFLVLHAVVFACLWRRRHSPLAVAATCVFVSTLAHGLVDIYWLAGAIPLSFILCGMGLGAADVDDDPSPPGGRHVQVVA